MLHRTMFESPLVTVPCRWLSQLILRLAGWRVVGEIPEDIPRCVMIAAPHTSNWDLPFTLMMGFVLRVRVYWMGKDAIFNPPFRRLMMWMGGVPIDRSKANNVVNASIKAIQEAERVVLLVPPEGTRSKVTVWKTGFYHIAHGAGVPILLGFLDFKEKTGGIGPVFWPTGDIERDMEEIKAFYATKTGKNAHQ